MNQASRDLSVTFPSHQPSSGSSLSGAMRRFCRMVAMDFRRGFGPVLVPLLIATGCSYFLTEGRSDTVLWGQVSVRLSWVFAILGPVGAAWGAWLAGRERRARTEILLTSTPTSSLVRDVRALTVPVLGVLVAYSGIAAFVLERTAGEATWGGPVWSVIVYGAWMITAYTVVGTIAGLLFPARLTPLIAGFGLLLFTTLTYTYMDSNSAYSYFAPFRWVSDLHAYDNVLFHGDRMGGQLVIAFALALGAVLVAFAVLLLVRFGRRSGVLVGAVAAVVLVPTIDAVIAPPGHPVQYRVAALADLDVGPHGPVENPPLVCGGEVVETCVHKAYEGQLDDIAAHVEAILTPVAGFAGVPERFEQRADMESTGEVARFIETWQWGDAEHVIERVVIEHLFSLREATDRGDGSPSQTPAQAALGLWLVRQAGGAGFPPNQVVGCEPPFVGGPASEAEIRAWQDGLAAIQQDIDAAASRFAALAAGVAGGKLVHATFRNADVEGFAMMSFPLRILFAGALRRPARPVPGPAAHLGSFFRLFQINARRASMLWVVLATASLAIFIISRFAVTEVVLWPEWSAYAARSFAVVGPAVAIWAATLAQRDQQPKRAEMMRATANFRVSRELGLAATSAIAALVCYALVASGVLAYAAMHATWGGPDIWLVGYGAAASVAFALAGWLIGTFIPGRTTAFFAGLLLVGYMIVSYTWGPDASNSAALQPWRYVEQRWGASMHLFHDTDPYAGMLHPGGGILVALGSSSLILAGYMRLRRTVRWPLMMLVIGLGLIAPGWMIANDTGTPTWEPTANPDMACGGEVVETCLHQAYEVQLDDAIAFADAFYAPLVGIAEVPQTVTHRPYREEPPAGTLPLNAFWTDTQVEQVMAQALGHALLQGESVGLTASQHAILTWLTEQASGQWFIGPTMEIDPMTRDPNVYQHYQADVDAAADRFAALSQEEQRTWLEANWNALRTGDLTLEDLP